MKLSLTEILESGVAMTDAERRAVMAVIAKGSVRAAGKSLKQNHSSVSRALARVRKRLERTPELTPQSVAAAPESVSVSRTTTLYRTALEDGHDGAVMQWVRRDHRGTSAESAALIAAEVLRDAEPYVPVPVPSADLPDEIMNIYTITDYHIGMLAHAQETLGDSWDIKIAERTLVSWFTQAVARSPRAKYATFVQLGDFLHWSGMVAKTEKHGHALDADTRFGKLVEVAVRALKRCTDILLAHHEHVHVINLAGNHDESAAPWLQTSFGLMYAAESRVTVDQSHSLYRIHTFGSTALMCHHGHGARPKQLAGIFAGQFPREFGAADFRLAFCGHRHSREQIEHWDSGGVIVRQHPTLAPNDAHSASLGYNSTRRAEVSTVHREYGEVAITCITPKMLEV